MYRQFFNKEQYSSLRKKLRNNSVKSEVLLWSCLKGKKLGFKFRRQQGIDNYIVDFYCPEIKLVIEVDGSTHQEETVFAKDIQRQKFLESLGLIVKRYSSDEVFNNLSQLLADVYNLCTTLRAAIANNTTPNPSSVRRGE